MLFHSCTVIDQFLVAHLEDLGPFVVEQAVLNLLDARIQTQWLLGEMSPLRQNNIEGHEIRGDVCDADRRTHPAHDAIHEHLGYALEVSEHGLPDAFAYIDLLRTGFRAGVA